MQAAVQLFSTVVKIEFNNHFLKKMFKIEPNKLFFSICGRSLPNFERRASFDNYDEFEHLTGLVILENLRKKKL